MTAPMHIVGICRFSMLGRGDWKAYRKQPEDQLEEITRAQAEALFSPERLDRRFRSFTEITLPSLAGQRDQDFRFLVISSDRLPAPYRQRLEAACARVPQVVLRFLPPVHVAEAQKAIIGELGLDFADCVQFRLDDDDGISRDFVHRARRHAQSLWPYVHFAITFSQHYYCVTDGETEGVYTWQDAFLGTGSLVRHRTKSVFEFAHYGIPRRMISLRDPGTPNLITHTGFNDTPRHEARILRKRGMTLASAREVSRAVERHFDYLSSEGLETAGIARYLARLAESPVGEAAAEDPSAILPRRRRNA